MSTPSEKPTCKHGETEGHEWIKYIPMHGPIKMRCSGPVMLAEKNRTE